MPVEEVLVLLQVVVITDLHEGVVCVAVSELTQPGPRQPVQGPPENLVGQPPPTLSLTLREQALLLTISVGSGGKEVVERDPCLFIPRGIAGPPQAGRSKVRRGAGRAGAGSPHLSFPSMPQSCKRGRPWVPAR